MKCKSFEFYKDFYDKEHIRVLQYNSLRKNFHIMVEKVLGENYYNMEMDVYESDKTCCEDITRKLQSLKSRSLLDYVLGEIDEM